MIGSFSALTSSIVTWNMFQNLRLRVKLDDERADLPAADAPLSELTLAIPVRNEEKNLRELLPLLFAQRVRPREILFLDDGSTDSTKAILDQAALDHPGVRVIAGAALPDHWRGKVWALHQLLFEARTDWVLFMDADVRPSSATALRAVWDSAERENILSGRGFLSVFGRPRVSRAAGLLVHQIHTHLYYFLPSFAGSLKAASAVAGCGQVMLLPRGDFIAMGGFEKLRLSTHDGLRLARMFKGAGRKVAAVDGARAIAVLTYENFFAAFRGFSRNDFEATGSFVGALVLSFFIYEIFVAPFAMFPFLFLNPLWLASFLWLLYAQFRMAEEFGFGKSHVLLTPVAGVASIGVHLWSAARLKMGRTVNWRGRET